MGEYIDIFVGLDVAKDVSGAPDPWFRHEVTSGMPSCN